MSINISASLLTDFVSCGKKPYFRINHPELQIQSKEMVLGTIVHKAVEKFWDSETLSIDYAVNALDLSIFNSKDNLIFLVGCLETFFSVFRPLLLPEDEVEKRFKIPLGKDVFLVGKMDRISNQSVFDWKTTRVPSTSVIGDIQLSIYARAYRHLYNKEPIACYYGFLATGRLAKNTRTVQSEDFIFNELIPDVVSNIRAGTFAPTGFFSKACYRCPYNAACIQKDL